MRLKRLVVHGFKSFKDRTTIHFETGITGIVGPNGCGKSNVVDALFWVMGEQSAKHLRGSTMKDVIFSGSSKYKPASWAEVTLVLDNHEGKHIHIGQKVCSPSEIQLTRKLYRNGESEFRINSMPCRLKDIQEVFMDTGAGAKSYSIIAQGEINKLIQAKPLERRAMIEEVAGITKFKVRRKESLKKIEQTQTNLKRLADIKTEIESNLSFLQKQAEKANRAKTLKEKIKNYELIVNSHKVYNSLKSLKDGESTINSSTIDLETWKTEKNKLELETGKDSLKKTELTEKIDIGQAEYNELSRGLAAKEERLKLLKEHSGAKEKEIVSREDDIKEVEPVLIERNAKLSELKDTLSRIQNLEDEGIDFSKWESELEGMKKDLDSKIAKLESVDEKIKGKNEQISLIERELIKNTSLNEEYFYQLERTDKEIEELEKNAFGFSDDVSKERDTVNKAKKYLDELEDQKASLFKKIEKNKKTYFNLEEDKKKREVELTQIRSNIGSLENLNDSYEGIQEGASHFLKSDFSKDLKLLGPLFKCEEKYTRAVESLLHEVSETVWGSEYPFDDIFTWLRENNQKGLDILLKIKESSTPRTDFGFPEIYALEDILNIEEEFRDTLKPLFNGFYIVPELRAMDVKKIEGDQSFKALVSLDGEVLIKNRDEGIFLSLRPLRNHSQGIIERNNKISLLKEELTDRETNLSEFTPGFEKAQTELLENEKFLESVRAQLLETKTNHAAINSSFEMRVQNIQSNTERLDTLKSRKQEISNKKVGVLELEEKLQKELDEKSDERSSFEATHKEQNIGLVGLKTTYESGRDKFYKNKVELSSSEERTKDLISQIEDINNQITRLNVRLEKDNERIIEEKEALENIAGEVNKLSEENKEISNTLNDKKDVLGLIKDELEDVMKSITKKDNLVKSLEKKMAKADKDMAQIEVKLIQYIDDEESIVRNVFEKYHIDLRETVGAYLEMKSFDGLHDVSEIFQMETELGPEEIQKVPFEFKKRAPGEVKDFEGKLNRNKKEYYQLGDINWQAIKDYEKQKRRFDFLREQEGELINSLEDLEKAIEHIDFKSKERFKIAFDGVKEKFRRIFPIIFGGGNADLRLVGGFDDPDCGVDIVAQPPGKKMQNVTLMSGGEKALTAICLLFAIFLIKPSPFVLLDEVDAPLDEANVGRFNELLKELSSQSQFILITHNKKTMSLNDTLYGITMQEPGVSKCVSVQLQ